jgi:nucleoside-triphosphatase THEP1
MNITPEPYPILAIVYSDGLAADRFISDLGYRIRDAGIAVAGIVQHNKFIRDRTRCDMEVEELASGIVLRLSEDRGKEARGCRLDRGALSEAGALISVSLKTEPELVILNKFGKLEAEGRGLRDTLSDAVQLGVPIVVGVPYRNIEQWRVFTEGLAEECPLGSSRLHEWLVLHGFNMNRKTAGAAAMVRVANID